MIRFLFICVCFFCHFLAQAQITIQGLVVYAQPTATKPEPVAGAAVYWLGAKQGTVTDVAGKFSLVKMPQHTQLVVTFVGCQNDTITVGTDAFVTITLVSHNTLQTVTMYDPNLKKATINAIEVIGKKELRKAACCNLSESFETNASVDVSTTDAVSGTKQIRLLGLDGTYAQIMCENMPFVRGLSARGGLYFIPGTWIKSIDINKGAGSVANGYESITGQINIELAKPENSEKLLLNLYANNGARIEANINYAQKIAERWHTSILAHHSRNDMAMDYNQDGFMDNPKFAQSNVINRWKYQDNRMESDIGFKALYEDKTAGQASFDHATGQTHDFNTPYGANFRTTRLEGFAKTGFFLGENEAGHINKSLGIILNYTHQRQNSIWGVNKYEGAQNSVLLNAIYQTESTKGNTWRLGTSLMSDEFQELYQENHHAAHLPNVHPAAYFNRKRREFDIGVFSEYNYTSKNKKLGIVAGLRVDNHNLWGLFLTPRLHAKYAFATNTILRLSGGRGQRTANPLIENASYLISSRKLYLPTAPLQEIGWNYGGSFSHKWFIGATHATLTLDFYRTDFEKQVIVDMFTHSQEIIITALQGKSFANSFQVGLDYEIHEKLTTRLAYKYYEVQADYRSLGLRKLPFIPDHRLLSHTSYTTPNEKWAFDFTAEYFGRQILPTTMGNPVEFTRPTRSPAYILINAQITRKLGKNNQWEVYIGGENIGNYRQQNPIIQADNPYGNYFDAGQVYAPIFGAMGYVGVRFTIE